MLQEPVIATMIILGLIALGEIISVISNARVPMLFVAMVGYLVLLWLGIFPQDLLANSTFLTVGAVLGTAPMLVHMGTLIPLKMVRSQWRAVIISVLGMFFASLFILTIVTFLFDYKTAVAGTGPLNGGIIAVLITSEGLKELGFVSLLTIPALIMALQSLIGIPIASLLLRKHAVKIQEKIQNGSFIASNNDSFEEGEEKLIVPKKYRTQLVLLFMLFIGGAIAVALSKVTGIPYSLWALAVGMIGRLVNFYPERVMEKANGFNIGMAGVIFMVIGMMNDITFDMFIEQLPAVATILIVGVLGILLGGFIGAKLFKLDYFLGIPVALTATFGFPGDYIVCEEVSRSIGKTEDEQKKIFSEILTPMLVGGFTTVTIGSVVIASILIKTI
ncbi:membrane protein [Lysinibacillus sp. CTST325]